MKELINSLIKNATVDVAYMQCMYSLYSILHFNVGKYKPYNPVLQDVKEVCSKLVICLDHTSIEETDQVYPGLFDKLDSLILQLKTTAVGFSDDYRYVDNLEIMDSFTSIFNSIKLYIDTKREEHGSHSL